MNIKPSHIEGEVNSPSSKSETIRLLLIAFFAFSRSKLENVLFSDDTMACIDIMEKLGCEVMDCGNHMILINSEKALKGISEITLDCKNSGTTSIFLTSLLSLYPIKVTFKGDRSLSKRPFGPLLKALEEMGAKVESTDGHMPFTIQGPIRGGKCTISCTTSQYLSSLLLALPLLRKDTDVYVPLLNEKPYVDLTLSLLEEQGIRIRHKEDYSLFSVYGYRSYRYFVKTVGGDFSSSTFFFSLAAIHGSKIKVNKLKSDSKQGDKRVLDILEEMGCSISWDGDSVTVTGQSELKGGCFDLNDIPDALPSLSVVSCFAKEEVKLINVESAREKECDRIHVMYLNLKRAGVKVKELPDGLYIKPSKVIGGDLKGHKDHRVIMALALLLSRSECGGTIDNTQSVSVTFPDFFKDFVSLGGKIDE